MPISLGVGDCICLYRLRPCKKHVPFEVQVRRTVFSTVGLEGPPQGEESDGSKEGEEANDRIVVKIALCLGTNSVYPYSGTNGDVAKVVMVLRPLGWLEEPSLDDIVVLEGRLLNYDISRVKEEY